MRKLFYAVMDEKTRLSPAYEGTIYDRAVLEWAKEPPTKPGWYMTDGNDGPVIALVKDGDSMLFVEFAGQEFDLIDFTYWLGPLPLMPLPDGE